MISINNLTVMFNELTPLEKIVLNNFNLKINDNDFITILGSNGAGKSTLFNSILGSVEYSGTIDINGEEIDKIKPYKRANNISIVYQDPARGTAPNLTVFENIMLANKNKIKNKKAYKIEVANDLKRFDLGLENELDKSCRFLSGGQRQVISLYMAMIRKPKLLLLDEHTAALDPKTALKIMKITDEIVKKSNVMTLMITHNLKTALEYGNRLIILNSGNVSLDICGEDKKKLNEEELLKTYSSNLSDVTLLQK